MRRIALPLLVTAFLFAMGSLALSGASAAPALQATATGTVRTTATARTTGTAQTTGTAPAGTAQATGTVRTTGTAQATAQATGTVRATGTPAANRTPTAGATSEVTGTATVTGTDTITDTETVTDTETLTDTETITGTETLTDTEATTDTADVSSTIAITGSILPLTLTGVVEDADLGRTITVVGQGEVTAIPDVAAITLGVETTNRDISEATEENDEAIAAILDAIEELDIPRRNVQTSSYNIFVERPQPVPGIESGEAATDTDTIYHVSQQIVVQIEDLNENLELVSSLIDEAVQAGANNVYGPTFQLSGDRNLQQSAFRSAVENAYERAQDWATLTGVDLIGVASVSEVIVNPPSPLTSASRGEDLGGGPSLQPGTLAYTQQVQVVFYIR